MGKSIVTRGFAMTQRQHRFVEGVLAGKSQTQAYIDAGYEVADRDAAAANASILIGNPKIARAIERARAKALKLADVTVEKVVMRTAAIAFSPDVRPADQLRALGMLGRYLGIFKERIVVESGINLEHLSDGDLRAILVEIDRIALPARGAPAALPTESA